MENSLAYDAKFYSKKEEGWFWYQENFENDDEDLSNENYEITLKGIDKKLDKEKKTEKANINPKVQGQEEKDILPQASIIITKDFNLEVNNKNKDKENNYSEKTNIKSTNPIINLISKDYKIEVGEDGLIRSKSLKKIMPEVLNKALDNPTYQNVLTYYLLMQMAMNKSETFSKVSSTLSLLNPSLDESSKRAQFPKALLLETTQKQKENEEKLFEIAKTSGIIFVYKGECPYCQSAISQLALLNKFNFKIIAINVDGKFKEEINQYAYRHVFDQGIVGVLGIINVPSFVLVVPNSKKQIAVVSSSLIKDSDLISRIISGYELLMKEE
ncbi:MAG: conjugal transfer protein TraF [Succinivibrionaceae bacterium]|nr:conjugal transfer protein TraF [Succinivibrionaceae bacterium]